MRQLACPYCRESSSAVAHWLFEYTDRAVTILSEQLHDASQNGLMDIVQYLCEQGADKEHTKLVVVA